MAASFVVMGVSGCGKSSVAGALAARLGLPAIEGDAFHPDANRDKMSRGIALTDVDRAGWLDRLAAELTAQPRGAVLACSALKRSYRDRLRAASPGLRFVWLDLSYEAALQRVSGRGASHFFPASIVRDQFDTLEPPLAEAGVLRLDATLPLARLETDAADWIART